MQWIVLSAAMLASPAIPQSTPHDARVPIVVRGRSGEVTRAYVDRVARPEPGRQLARWNAPLCVTYDGVEKGFARFIHARIAATAGKFGLKMAGPRCSTSVVIKLTDQADALARDLVRTSPPQVGSVTSGRAIPRRTIDALTTPRTIRWLTASATVGADGESISAEGNRVWMPSLIRSTTREDLHTKIIIIDSARLANVSLNQLADYIAFVTLASPDVAADFTDTDSIMALFAGGGSARLTQQDIAFLEALYTISPARTAAVQKRAIGKRMTSGTSR